MTVKVSVVVAVYNPGEQIEPLVRSLLAQTMPAAELEVVFVDDGSTDGTGERLQELVEDNPNMRLATIPNSGWPGRPRNVGTDLAQGEYVFYSDNDDEFFPEALERMYDLAAANGSDIVFGKIVRVGRAGDPPARRNIGKGDPISDGLLRSRTVHKLYRRAFLVQHEIRFLEGRVRLEDHQFMAQAMPRAGVVSVLADYPCYAWIHRNDGSNSSSAVATMPTDQYWGYYTGAVRTFAETAGEGELLDEARLVAVEQSFARYSARRWAGWTEPHQAEVFAAVRTFLQEAAPTRLDPRLPVLKRVRVAALRAGDLDRFDRLQLEAGHLTAEVRLDQVAWVDGVLRIGVTARLLADPGTTTDDTMSAGPLGQLTLGVGAELGILEADRVLLDSDLGSLQLTVRDRATGVEWPVDGSATPVQEQDGDNVRLAVRLDARLDPETAALGQPLTTGIWDLFARVSFLGETERVGVPATPDVAATWVGARQARTYVTTTGRLALKLTEAPLPRALAVRVGRAVLAGDGLTLTLTAAPAGAGSRAWVVLRRRGADGPLGPFPVEGQLVSVDLTPTTPGQSWQAYLRVESAAGVADELLSWAAGPACSALPYAVHRSANGGVTLRHLRPGDAPPQNAEGPAPSPVERAIGKVRRELGRRIGRGR